VKWGWGLREEGVKLLETQAPFLVASVEEIRACGRGPNPERASGDGRCMPYRPRCISPINTICLTFVSHGRLR